MRSSGRDGGCARRVGDHRTWGAHSGRQPRACQLVACTPVSLLPTRKLTHRPSAERPALCYGRPALWTAQCYGRLTCPWELRSGWAPTLPRLSPTRPAATPPTQSSTEVTGTLITVWSHHSLESSQSGVITVWSHHSLESSQSGVITVWSHHSLERQRRGAPSPE